MISDFGFSGDPFHSLHRSMLSTLTPEIRAKEGYEIRFCDDLFISLIREYHLYFNDVELQYGNDKFLNLEYDSALQLNLISLNNEKSLINILNRCNTSFGSRLFKERLLQPIIDKNILNERYSNIEKMLEGPYIELFGACQGIFSE